MSNRVDKSIAHRLAVMLSPEFGDALSGFRAKRDGWVKLPPEIEQIRKNTGLGDSYVLAYEDENRILYCLFKTIFPVNTVDEIKQQNDEFMAATPEERDNAVNEMFVCFQSEEFDLTLDSLYPKTEADCEAARKKFEALSSEEKTAVLQTAQYFLIYFYGFFYNYLSLMVHGQKLTTLVPLALQGDKKAFCKAVHIDRNLLTGHPYFKDTYTRLQSGDDPGFLRSLLYRIGNPHTQGKIRFPVLYMVFASLDSSNWLDDFTASEILDICDEAQLDRFQNRIEDESSLIKRRIEYRRFQKYG